ncbi:MAG: ASPIC/UnbV domain-containing protein, partial [Thermoanaerobaculia bacterium]|nr:ASPIC/UnbV domain-containing protein [Thermoanaerobaculia bacterium]
WLGLRAFPGPAGLDLRATVVAGGRERRAVVASGRSYLSASETRLAFGLGPGERPESLEVRWPSGARQRLLSPPALRTLVLPATPAGR